MGVQAAPELLGIHSNMPGIFPNEIDKLALSGAPAPAGLSADEKIAYERVQFVYQKGDRVRIADGSATADVVWNRGLSRGTRGILLGPRRARLYWENWGKQLLSQEIREGRPCLPSK
jgi:hypothetical protein